MKTEISTFSPTSRNKPEGEKNNLHVPGSSAKIAVVGAGIMGICTAYYLQQHGFSVTLFDKRGPGNAASSSGGESRLLRLLYGASHYYSELTHRAIPLWMELQKNTDPFFIPSPVLWISGEENRSMIESSLSYLDSKDITYKVFSDEELRRNFPFMHSEDVKFAVMEELSGYLKARYACQSIAAKFVDAGGLYLTESVSPPESDLDILNELKSSNGYYKFDYIVVAAGPWLNEWVSKPLIEVTRQDVLYFDLLNHHSFNGLTSWVDLSYEPYFYGIPGDLTRGFKLACDLRGAIFDPDHDSRIPNLAGIEEARKFLKFRFPSLANAPLLEYRVCQYSNSADRNLIMDIHPQFQNVLLVGGGSGHGFKYGPIIGKIASDFIAGKKPIPVDLRFF